MQGLFRVPRRKSEVVEKIAWNPEGVAGNSSSKRLRSSGTFTENQ
jgi:hypothetical protein